MEFVMTSVETKNVPLFRLARGVPRNFFVFVRRQFRKRRKKTAENGKKVRFRPSITFGLSD
jgi:hypothetical protein